MTEDMNTKDLSDRVLLELMRREMNFRFENVEEQLSPLEARTNPLPPNYDALLPLWKVT